MTGNFFTDAEIAEMCHPLTTAAAQCRHLRRMNLLITTKPNGRPLLARSEYERVYGAARHTGLAPGAQNAAAGPNVHALQAWQEKRKHGTRAQGR